MEMVSPDAFCPINHGVAINNILHLSSKVTDQTSPHGSGVKPSDRVSVDLEDAALNVLGNPTGVGDALEGRGFQSRDPKVVAQATTEEFKIETTYNTGDELKEHVDEFAFDNMCMLHLIGIMSYVALDPRIHQNPFKERKRISYATLRRQHANGGLCTPGTEMMILFLSNPSIPLIIMS